MDGAEPPPITVEPVAKMVPARMDLAASASASSNDYNPACAARSMDGAEPLPITVEPVAKMVPVRMDINSSSTSVLCYEVTHSFPIPITLRFCKTGGWIWTLLCGHIS
eukprot:CAMPEP_0184475754 /NCGR_PEP_ID=MMETSP0740-20130409/146729_1 /TAXON_ID=385413 /ORGANISM="Thalassiosira miniscula, Strain CCMP1093" /LENGTH=107 /DNA_ID=CAMNT_0026853287 /DNA_START=309 /DNA_END=633 /DNA_ORIENTATION=+